MATRSRSTGDTAAVGAPNDNVGGLQNRGAVYISRIGSTWTFQTTISPSDPKANERFGQSVALNGVTLVVGTSERSTNVQNHGSAYVFVGSGPAWAQQQKLTSTGLTEFGGFGAAVAIDGSAIVVGAHVNRGEATARRAPPTCSSAAAPHGRCSSGSSPTMASIRTASAVP